jgi:glyoxylase-like metal-dependent hydrolase (beta-lactamase superfamily II)
MHRELGVEVTAGGKTAQAVEVGDEHAISLDLAKRRGIYPPAFRFEACPVSHVLNDGETIAANGVRIEAISTPGHSADMTSYLVHRGGGKLLFPGDTIFHGGKVSVQATWDCNPQAYAASIERLSTLDADALFPGHGTWCLSHASASVEAAMHWIGRLLLPPNL